MSIHYHKELHPDLSIPDPHQGAFSRATLGFWLYLMTDCILFCTLFATYAVLHKGVFGGPSAKDLFSFQTAFIETLVLLFSSFASGLGLLASLKNQRRRVLFWLSFAFLLGASFVVIELREFHEFIANGHDWKTSAFLSSFFTLVGTHGLHVSIGLLWMLVMMCQTFFLGITIDVFRRIVIFSLFWHFLDLVWIFIFTVVYLLGLL